MKVALVSTERNGAVDQVMRDVLKYIKQVDVDVFYAREIANEDFGGYDLVHWSWMGMKQFKTEVEPPITGGVWGIPVDQWKYYYDRFGENDFAAITADDDGTVQQLQQLVPGRTKIKQIPLTRDFTQYRQLSPPTGPFTVACFGNEYESKRFDVVVEACKLAEVKCWRMTFPKFREHNYYLDPIRDVYGQCHLYAHAAYVDTNSLPCMEALACGRPVVAAISSGLRRALKVGVNGEFFDGSASDLAAKIITIRDDYEGYCGGVKATILPSIEEVAKQYEEVWLDAIQRSK